ncbi:MULTISPECIES: phage tail spike protein [unclassified Clostridium]|uniref:phage tail spike protein n=1 Tax=unclassified Clostridium TaxID=2614128 RepID=UPI001484ED73|nr:MULTISPECIES: phage tail spike protein [unclassified Clostridium]
MLKICDRDGVQQYALAGVDYSVTHAFDGEDTLEFDLPASHEAYGALMEEIRVETGDNRFVIKALDEYADGCTVDCQLDLDEWKNRFYKNFAMTQCSLAEVLAAIAPPGWTVTGAVGILRTGTVEAEYATDYDLLGKTAEAFGVVFNYDVPARRVTVIDPEGIEPGGAYLVEELNLKKMSYKGISTDLVTRLYAYGKDGLTFADINGGKEYVEDLSYCDKVISAVWKANDYTDAAQLKADAEKQLKSLAYPVRSYECDVVDLAAVNPDYAFLGNWMYQVVTLMDKRRGTRQQHQVVEYKEYPLSPENNVVTLSTAVPKIEGSIKQIKNQLEDVREGVAGQGAAIENATALITGAKGGNVVLRMDAQGKPTEILVMDTEDIDAARKVWRWNMNGLGFSQNGIAGPYETAITIDGAIVADFITAGTMSANLIRSGVIMSQDGNSKIDLDSGNSELNGTFSSENGAYKVKFWGGMMQFFKNDRATMDLYSVGGDDHHGVLRIFDWDQNELTSIAGGGLENKSITTGDVYLRLGNGDRAITLWGYDGVRELGVDRINGFDVDWVWSTEMNRYVLAEKK